KRGKCDRSAPMHNIGTSKFGTRRLAIRFAACKSFYPGIARVADPEVVAWSLGLKIKATLYRPLNALVLLGVCGIGGPPFQHHLREGCSWRGVRARAPTNNQGIRRYNGRRR